ncbi:MAG: hypothetical protein ABI690_18600 [Chloroflexota bacterium]
MSKAKPFDANVEVLGAVIIAISQSINSDELVPILEAHGLSNVQQDRWYPASTWIDALNDIAAHDNGSMNLVSASIKVSENIPQADGDGTIKGAFVTANDTYNMSHRGGYIGEINVESSKEKEVTVSAYSPYPDDYLYGAFYGHARRHAPKGSNLRIYRDKPYVYRIAW